MLENGHVPVDQDAISQATKPPPFSELLNAEAHRKSFSRGQEICGVGEPAEHWYRIDVGVARQISIREDGRRQIVDLLLVGDYFGFTVQDDCDFAIEAVVDGTVISLFPRQRLEKLAETNVELARVVRRATFEAMARLQTSLLVLGRVTAREKVASFLLDLSTRLVRNDRERLVLPVTRYDIADNLAISVETVSRALTSLRQQGAIRMTGARIICILDRNTLEDCRRRCEVPFR
jgi:CRP/FNR family transcriptional regulator, nitrogen fixation regulation protein